MKYPTNISLSIISLHSQTDSMVVALEGQVDRVRGPPSPTPPGPGPTNPTLVPPGGQCRDGDICTGQNYTCRNGICTLFVIKMCPSTCPRGTVCVVDTCVSDGSGNTGRIDLWGDCTNDPRGCKTGLSCVNSPTNGSDRKICYNSAELD